MNEARVLLSDALAEFDSAWRKARLQWGDSAGRYFEEEFVQPVLMETPPLVKSMEDVATVFQRARRELE